MSNLGVGDKGIGAASLMGLGWGGTPALVTGKRPRPTFLFHMEFPGLYVLTEKTFRQTVRTGIQTS